MKYLRLILMVFLLGGLPQVQDSISAQEISDAKIIGLWSMPFKSAGAEGSVILDCQRDHSLSITKCFTIDDIVNAAFTRCTGTWQLNSGKLYLYVQSETHIKWTAEISKQFESFQIPVSQTNAVLSTAGNNAPSLKALRFGDIMRVRSLSDKEMTLSTGEQTPIKLHRISAYPKGGRINVSDPIRNKEPQRSIKTIEIPSLKEVKKAMGAETSYVEPEESENVKNVVARTSISRNTEKVVAADSTVVEVAVPMVDDTKIYDVVEQKPQFPGGDKELQRWLAANMIYPSQAISDGTQGRVMVQFVVLKDGSIGESRVVRRKSKELDEEALRLVRTLPKFIPGKMSGVPVSVWYTLPIMFKLPEGNS